MVSFSQAALDAFLEESDNSAFAMLNLIRFEPDGGREKYSEYHRLAKPSLVRFGVKVMFAAAGLPVLTADQTQGWDAVVLVQYPNRAAFKAMVADPEYQGAFAVGAAAIADIVLQPLEVMEGV